jgi:hypothetical protein
LGRQAPARRPWSFKPPFARPSRAHRPPQSRGNAPYFQVWYGLEGAALRAGSSCADRSTMPSCGASCECRTQHRPVRLTRPIDARCERTGASTGALTRAADSGTNNRRARAPAPKSRPRRLPSLLGDFELHRSLRFLLHEGRSRDHVASPTDVLHLKSRQITCPELAVDCEIEQCQLATVR